MTDFEQFLQEESTTLKRYRNKVILKNLVVAPSFLIICFAIFKAESLIYAKEDFSVILDAIISVVPLALIISFVYLLLIAFALQPSNYIKKIQQATGWINLSEQEIEELGADMLAAYPTERKLDFFIKHISAKNTPAKFICGKKFAYLCGLTPYAIFVKLDDIERMEISQQELEIKRSRVLGKRRQMLTFYLVNFYLKNIEKENSDDIDVNFGFFDKAIRDSAYEMIASQIEENAKG